jgi:hypothetical protein
MHFFFPHNLKSAIENLKLDHLITLSALASTFENRKADLLNGF